MVRAPCRSTEPVPPPAYHRALVKGGPALHIDALTLVTRLHRLALCRQAVHLAHRQGPVLPAPRRGRPCLYRAESLLLIGLLRVLWRLSYRDMTDWLNAWPARAEACGVPSAAQGRPCVPSPAQQCKRQRAAGAPPVELLFVCTMRAVLAQGLTRLRDLIIDSAPLLAWRTADPDATYGHASAHHATALVRGFRVHTVLCRGSDLSVFFRVAPANGHDASFAQPLLSAVLALYGRRSRVVRLDAAYGGTP